MNSDFPTDRINFCFWEQILVRWSVSSIACATSKQIPASHNHFSQFILSAFFSQWFILSKTSLIVIIKFIICILREEKKKYIGAFFTVMSPSPYAQCAHSSLILNGPPSQPRYGINICETIQLRIAYGCGEGGRAVCENAHEADETMLPYNVVFALHGRHTARQQAAGIYHLICTHKRTNKFALDVGHHGINGVCSTKCSIEHFWVDSAQPAPASPRWVSFICMWMAQCVCVPAMQ